MPFRWRADDGQTLNAGLVVCDFQGIRTNIAKEPYIFVIFQGVEGSASGSAHTQHAFNSNLHLSICTMESGYAEGVNNKDPALFYT